ncbi:MAG: 30S ribosomal protein S16 [Spirochaetales bacterium]|nr:30S ribosomal protein S16 [Spirochaetales bacterium]
MSVSMRLKRFGSKKRPYYRVVVQDSRTAPKGKTIDEVGFYRPIDADNQIQLNTEKVQDWLAKGAQPSPTVKGLLNKQGIAVNRTPVQE